MRGLYNWKNPLTVLLYEMSVKFKWFVNFKSKWLANVKSMCLGKVKFKCLVNIKSKRELSFFKF